VSERIVSLLVVDPLLTLRLCLVATERGSIHPPFRQYAETNETKKATAKVIFFIAPPDLRMVGVLRAVR
jgi:hypothetical protein